MDEVIDLEDVRTGVSITDLGLNDFRTDLLGYVKDGLGAPAGVEFVEFFLQERGSGFNVLADPGGVVVDLDGDLLEARGYAGDPAAGGGGVLAAHASHKVQRPAGVLCEVADVLVVAFVDVAVKPALGGPGLDEREPGLGFVVVEVAFEPDEELGLGDGAVAEAAVHELRAEAEVRRRAGG